MVSGASSLGAWERNALVSGVPNVLGKEEPSALFRAANCSGERQTDLYLMGSQML
jgi:hypothetical protein